MRHRTLRLPALALLLASAAQGQTEYYRHSVFDNSLERDFYYYSFAQATAPSTLEGNKSRLPVDSVHFLSPPNALRIRWQSMPAGGWDAEVHLVNFRNRSPGLSGRTLYFWIYSPTAISAGDLPNVILSQAREGLQVAAGGLTPLTRFSQGADFKHRSRRVVAASSVILPTALSPAGSRSHRPSAMAATHHYELGPNASAQIYSPAQRLASHSFVRRSQASVRPPGLASRDRRKGRSIAITRQRFTRWRASP